MKVNYNKDGGGQIIYGAEDWLGGVDFTSSGTNDRKIGDGLSVAINADPLRALGYLSPGVNPSDVTNVSSVDSYLRNGVNNGSDSIIISGGDKVQKMSANTISVASPFPHTISDGHASYVGDDITSYYTQTTARAFFSYNDGTDWNVGIYNFVADTFDDDFMSTAPASPLAAPYLTGGKGYPHPLIVADDNVLYIGDRNFVHTYYGQNGATGTFTPAVLTLPNGFIITSFCKTNDRRLMIAGYYWTPASASGTDGIYLGRSQVWVWNLLDLDPDFAYNLNDNYVSEIRNWNGRIVAFTSGNYALTSASGFYKLQILNNDRFEILTSWNTGGLPIRGGVDNSQDEIYWNSSGVIMCYTKNPYNGNFIYNQIASGSGTTSGMLRRFVVTTKFYISSGATTSGGLQAASTDYTSSSQAYGLASYPSFPPLKRGRLKKFTINFKSAVTSGRSLTIGTILDKTDSSITLAAITSVSNLKQIVIDTRTDQTPLGDFTSLQPIITWGAGTVTDAPVVESLIYDFEETNI